jgi:mannose-6-phosphate isomerase-like protein (cupin superfamily)
VPASLTKPTTPSNSHEGDGEWLQTRPGERCCIRVPAAATGGAYSVVEIVSSPGDSTPMHIHRNEDEHLVILEGTARIALGDKTFDAAAGTGVFLPRNIPHAWGNASKSPLRFLGVCTAGGVEEVLRLIARGEVSDLVALSAKFGVQIVGPLLIEPEGHLPERRDRKPVV